MTPQQKAVRVITLAGTVAIAALFGWLSYQSWWNSQHPELVVVPPLEGASVELDGQVACPSLPAWEHPYSLQTCLRRVTLGEHTVVTRNQAGVELNRQTVTITEGPTFVVSYDLPATFCLTIEERTYSREGGQPHFTTVQPGFVALPPIDYVFRGMPPTITSKADTETHRSLLVTPCH